VSLSDLNSSCRGYAQEAPNHIVMAQAPMRFLAIMVNTSFDSTLFVQTPDGQVWCNDDTDGLQPRLEISSPPGPIRIWVGAYSATGGGPYRLGLSGSPAVRGAQLGMPGTGGLGVVVTPPPPPRPGLMPAAPPLYGDVSLRSGFRPDPVMLGGSAGGPIDASTIDPSCRGWLTPQPSHVIQAQTGFRGLRFVGAASHDTTLLVQYPDGRIACDDDGGGARNPLVQGPTMPGPIRVWVGSYSARGGGPYTLGVTENPGMTYAMLGSGGGGGGIVVVPPTTPTPPPTDVTRVSLMPRIPVTLFGPGMSTATIAVWSPRGGPSVELSVTPSGGSLSIGASVGGTAIPLFTVPAEIARDATVTVTQRPDQRLLVRAERPPGGADPGAQMLLLVGWPGARAAAPAIADQWTGTFQERLPRWAR
jgi:hypothetical protein